jgi:nicotinamidase-related amidase
MEAVSSVVDFKDHYESATLVLVDLHGDPGFSEEAGQGSDLSRALEKCRSALGFARVAGLPLAFVRHKPVTASMFDSQSYPSWLPGFRPYRTDMVFERASPSCYASMEFADMARRSRNLVLAGVFGETSCLATLIEGHGRNHRFTFLADACVSRGRGDISAEAMHQSVVGIASLYSEVSSTEGWIKKMSENFASAG